MLKFCDENHTITDQIVLQDLQQDYTCQYSGQQKRHYLIILSRNAVHWKLQ